MKITIAIEVTAPLYKQVKGSLPGGPYVEGFLGFGTQLAKDLTDRTGSIPRESIFPRAIAAGVEDAITELVSSPMGGALVEVGSLCGPAAPVCAVGGYLIGANATTWFMDTIVWEPINRNYGFYR